MTASAWPFLTVWPSLNRIWVITPETCGVTVTVAAGRHRAQAVEGDRDVGGHGRGHAHRGRGPASAAAAAETAAAAAAPPAARRAAGPPGRRLLALCARLTANQIRPPSAASTSRMMMMRRRGWPSLFAQKPSAARAVVHHSSEVTCGPGALRRKLSHNDRTANAVPPLIAERGAFAKLTGRLLRPPHDRRLSALRRNLPTLQQRDRAAMRALCVLMRRAEAAARNLTEI